jgi:hypothetical protein
MPTTLWLLDLLDRRQVWQRSSSSVIADTARRRDLRRPRVGSRLLAQAFTAGGRHSPTM